MSERIFKRKIYQKLLQWKEDSKGKTALLIEGPRRVGKSTVVRIFAQNEYKSHIIIDFNKAGKQIHELFNDLHDLDYLFLYLQTYYHVSLIPGESVIVFDEVQKCPQARQAIKYLVEDGRYQYIETGSLISIKQNIKDITLPSEEETVRMYPMDFEEFQWAQDDMAMHGLLEKFWIDKKPLGSLHRDIMRQFRLYMIVGGMPQAVEEYINTNDFRKVDNIKRRIIKLYEDDFFKIDPSGRSSRLFASIPAQLSRNIRRYSTSAVIGKQNDDTLSELLRGLADSKTVNVCYHCDDPSAGMSLTCNDSQYKLYVADTGLFITLAFRDKDYTDNIIYQKLLLDKLPANLGYVYENMVSQILVSMGNQLYYYTWQRDEKHYYEIDFLLAEGHKISPVEVKSSNPGSHASLDVFNKKFASRINKSYIVSPKEYSEKGNEITLPPYFLPFITLK